MTTYNVHIYREMRLTFEGIEADTPETAANIARDKATGDADDIDDCEGESFYACVDVKGDADYEQSRWIDFEPERERKAAPKLLAALKWITRCPIIKAPLGMTAYIVSDERMAVARGAVAEAETAGILPDPGSPPLLSALTAVLPYAESEAESLYECWKRDGDLHIKDAYDRCEQAIERARTAIAQAKAAGIAASPVNAPHEPSRFDIEHKPAVNPDRVYVLVDRLFDVTIIRTDKGIVVDVYAADGAEPIASTYAFDSDARQPAEDAPNSSDA